MKKHWLLYFVFFLPIFFASCSHYYYYPSAFDAPLFTDSKETYIKASYGEDDIGDAVAMQVQAGFSPEKSLGINLTSMYAYGYKTGNNYGKGGYWDVNIGYNTNYLKFLVFETYGGVGYAYQKHKYENDGASSLSFFKYYLQADLGIKSSCIDLAGVVRYSNFFVTKASSTLVEQSEYYWTYMRFVNSKNRPFFEYGALARVGYKFIKVEGQCVFVDNDNFGVIDFAYSFGIMLNINKTLDFIKSKPFKGISRH